MLDRIIQPSHTHGLVADSAIGAAGPHASAAAAAAACPSAFPFPFAAAAVLSSSCADTMSPEADALARAMQRAHIHAHEAEEISPSHAHSGGSSGGGISSGAASIPSPSRCSTHSGDSDASGFAHGRVSNMSSPTPCVPLPAHSSTGVISPLQSSLPAPAVDNASVVLLAQRPDFDSPLYRPAKSRRLSMPQVTHENAAAAAAADAAATASVVNPWRPAASAASASACGFDSFDPFPCALPMPSLSSARSLSCQISPTFDSAQSLPDTMGDLPCSSSSGFRRRHDRRSMPFPSFPGLQQELPHAQARGSVEPLSAPPSTNGVRLRVRTIRNATCAAPVSAEPTLGVHSFAAQFERHLLRSFPPDRDGTGQLLSPDLVCPDAARQVSPLPLLVSRPMQKRRRTAEDSGSFSAPTSTTAASAPWMQQGHGSGNDALRTAAAAFAAAAASSSGGGASCASGAGSACSTPTSERVIHRASRRSASPMQPLALPECGAGVTSTGQRLRGGDVFDACGSGSTGALSGGSAASPTHAGLSHPCPVPPHPMRMAASVCPLLSVFAESSSAMSSWAGSASTRTTPPDSPHHPAFASSSPRADAQPAALPNPSLPSCVRVLKLQTSFWRAEQEA